VTDELVAWLRQQLDEDERVARSATMGPWQWGPSIGKISWVLTGPAVPYGGFVLGVSDAGCPSTYDAEHIARFDPQRMLDEVKAKRLILASITGRLCPGEDDDGWVSVDAETDGLAHAVLRTLTQPYAGRPGWNKDWEINA
jgi:hypothetical protein